MKTYSFKLVHHWRKFNYLRHLLEVANEIFNFQLATKKEAYKLDKTNLSKNDLQKITKDRRNSEEFFHWKDLNSQVVQQISDRIDLSYQMFFKNLKLPKGKKRKVSPPKYKPLRKQQSITFKQTGFKLDQENSKIKIGKHTFKYHNSREIKGEIKTLTVKKNRLGEFFIFITTDHTEKVPQSTTRVGKSIGFDFGLKIFLTASTGPEDDITSPLFFKQNINKIKKLSKELSSKKKGSNNRSRARRKLAKAYLDVSNQRKDFHWKLALDLVNSYDIICLETLNIKAMHKLWGKKISDLAFSSFLLILQYLAEKYDCKLVFIDRWYASSKTCHYCGYKNNNLELREREWECQECHILLDRDRNAAVNIQSEGLKTLKEETENRDRALSLAGANIGLPTQQEDIIPFEEAVSDDRRILRIYS